MCPLEVRCRLLGWLEAIFLVYSPVYGVLPLCGVSYCVVLLAHTVLQLSDVQCSSIKTAL